MKNEQNGNKNKKRNKKKKTKKTQNRKKHCLWGGKNINKNAS